MTYKEAKEMGYKNMDATYQRGYVSRKADIDKLEVREAGGNRKGQKYVLLPCWVSTNYCIRQYIAK